MLKHFTYINVHSKYTSFYFIDKQIQCKPKLVDLDEAKYTPQIFLAPTKLRILTIALSYLQQSQFLTFSHNIPSLQRSKLESVSYLWLEIWMQQHIPIRINCKIVSIWTKLKERNEVYHYMVLSNEERVISGSQEMITLLKTHASGIMKYKITNTDKVIS